MQEAAVSALSAWQNFYVIVGSAAGALTGLMFVVITLIAGARRRGSSGTVAAFTSPTVVHFCIALFVAMIITAPWPMLWNAALMLGLAGLGGVIYVFIITRRVRNQNEYQPVLEDWLFHTIFPLVSYLALMVAAFVLPGTPSVALFMTGAATVVLVFTGIHNSWDTVTFVAIELNGSENKGQD